MSRRCQVPAVFAPPPQVLSAAASIVTLTQNSSPSKQYPFETQARDGPFWLFRLRISSVFPRVPDCGNLQPWNYWPPHVPGTPPASATEVHFHLPQMPTGPVSISGTGLENIPAPLCPFGLQTSKGKSTTICPTRDRQRKLQLQEPHTSFSGERFNSWCVTPESEPPCCPWSRTDCSCRQR